LIVVVVIIGITAALATPSVIEQMRERRARATAQSVALLYTNARMRALGRGGAVMVQYNRDAGTFTVRESIEGRIAAGARGVADCGDQPGAGCLTARWDADDSRIVETFALDQSFLEFKANDGQANMNICFNPLGRSFISFTADAPETPMTSAVTFGLTRKTGGGTFGVLEDGKYWRKVAILPNGIARVAL
jgi:type II secretory pathway pseudopilin PulG